MAATWQTSGETKEFLWARDFLNKLRVPYVCLLGNHDCLGTGFDVYQKVFGSDNFALRLAMCVLFV